MTKHRVFEKLKLKAKELKKYVSALYLAYKQKDVPLLAKILIFITIAYALSPIDLIPDFIPVLGYLDDLIILPLLITVSIKLIPREIMDECKEQAENMWKNGKPKKWYYALPVIILYVLITAVLIKNVFF
jgi:uncharacterized membrane protein YkvA (DUF1232 family)